jgi:hypothetical protein
MGGGGGRKKEKKKRKEKNYGKLITPEYVCMIVTAQQSPINQFTLKTHTDTSHIKCHVSQTVEERTVHLVHKMNTNKSAKKFQ